MRKSDVIRGRFGNSKGKMINLVEYFHSWDTNDFIQACIEGECYSALAHHVNGANEDLSGLNFSKKDAENELKIIDSLYDVEIDPDTNEHFYNRKS